MERLLSADFESPFNKDYRGEQVLAAYTYLAPLKMGLIGKLNLWGIHKFRSQYAQILHGITIGLAPKPRER